MDYMRRALTLARRAQGTTGPLPPVGAVLVRDGKVVGEGVTQPPGGAHAEVMALRAAGINARGAMLHVTLEPCVHFGRTPPCVDALVSAGIAGVHYALVDENPRVAGKGLAALQAAGVPVVLDQRFEWDAHELAAPHGKYLRTGLPYVTVKFASSLDGKIATHAGESKWITGPVSQSYAHRVRARVDAIVVGVRTVLTDDPELTARPGDRVQRRQPLRVVVDSEARTPPAARLLKAPGRCLIAVGREAPEDAVEALEAAGAEVIRCPGQDRRVGLQCLMRELAKRECINILVEGGGELVGSFFDAGLADRLLAFMAPLVIGGREALPAVGGDGADPLAGAWRLRDYRVHRLGRDLLVDGLIGRPDPAGLIPSGPSP